MLRSLRQQGEELLAAQQAYSDAIYKYGTDGSQELSRLVAVERASLEAVEGAREVLNETHASCEVAEEIITELAWLQRRVLSRP